MPVAKEVIFNSIGDGVIVLDKSNRLIEFNQAIRDMFPELDASVFGSGFHEVWFRLSGGAFPFQLEAVPFTREVQLMVQDAARTYQIRALPLQYNAAGKGVLIIVSDITELKILQIQLEHQAYYDELTQIYNRRAFFQQCNREFAEAQNAHSAFTVILMDVDYFKRVNDTYGHHIGDQLLMHVVKVFQTELGEGALFARYGGEEFVFALSGYTPSEGEALADHLRISIEERQLLTAEGAVSVTVSCGVAGAAQCAGETLDGLLNKADKALYAAKKEGRNRVRVYKEEANAV
nr:sensor domain-containing diguanylate cyclase [Ectobacillus ponti]